MSFKGDLSTIGLAEVFQMISMSAREGTLVVQDTESKKAIYFGKDGVQLLSSGRRKGIKIGDILVRAGKISVGQLRDTLERQQASKKLLGEELIEGGLVTQADIDDVVRSQIEEEIYDLFLWKKAIFEFIDGAPVDELRDPDSRTIRLAFDVNALLLEAVRRTDEWTLINQKIPSQDCVYIWADEAAKGEEEGNSNRSVKAVAQCIDGQSSVNEVVEASLVPKFEVCKIFVDLLDRGRIRLLSVPELTTVAKRRLEEGRRDKGFRLFQVAALLAPEDAELLGTYAHAMETEGLIQDAARMYVRVGNILKAHSQKKDALAYFQRAVSLNPDDAQSKLALFEIHLAGGNVEDAVHTANEVINAALKERDYDTARMIAEQAVEAAPQNTDIRLSLARVYHSTGEKARRNEVVTYLQKNLPVDPIAASKLQAELAEMQDSIVQQRTAQVVVPKTGRSRLKARKRKKSLVVVGVVVLLLAGGGFAADFVARNTYSLYKADAEAAFGRKKYDEASDSLQRFAASWIRFHPMLKSSYAIDLAQLKARIEDEKRAQIPVVHVETDAEKLKKLDVEMERLDGEITAARDRGEINREFSAVFKVKESAEKALELAKKLKDKAKESELNNRIAASGAKVTELSAYITAAETEAKAAAAFEAAGKYKQAAAAVYSLLSFHYNADVARNATYPLCIRVSPPGARVVRSVDKGGQKVDEAVELKDGMVVLRLNPRDTFAGRAEKSGFKPFPISVTDPRTGEVLVALEERVEDWRGTGRYAITAPIEGDAQTLYVACDQVVAAVSKSGGQGATHRLASNVLVQPKLTTDGKVFVVAGRDLVGLNMEPGLSDRVVFSYTAEQVISGQPVFSEDNNLVFIAANDKLLALRARSNPVELHWSYDLPRRAIGNLFRVGGVLVVVCGDGTILGLKNLDLKNPEATTPEEAWGRIVLGGTVTQGATMSGSSLVVVSGQHLVAINAEKGQEIARVGLREASATPACSGSMIAVASGKNVLLFQFNADGGTLQAGRTITLPEAAAEPAILGSTILVGSADKNLYCFTASTGELCWKCPTGGKVKFAPVMGDKLLYFGSDDGVLRGLGLGAE